MAVGLALSWASAEAQKQEEQAWCPLGFSGFSIRGLLQWSSSLVTSSWRSTIIHLRDPCLCHVTLLKQRRNGFFFFFWHVCVRFKDRHGICKGVMGAHTTASLVVSISTLGNIVHHVGDFKSLSSY